MSDARYMLDASAVLAMMLGEDGGNQVRERLASSQISTVNLSEVVSKLQDGGVPDEVITSSLAELNFDVIAFNQSQAVRAGLLRASTRSNGLSLGDRACLSAAESCNAVAVTTDRAWGKLELDIVVEVLR
ncbi:MAG: type II toxin-antitoxin system VapC family toxin [Erythrobacter sp.]|nr:type II toxin-antitoxin system VapC family toxin [Erythrobacter sp.]MDZ4272639.1 type II toxin-antitoxin system VapC family toxin [Erythrobacter sp.]